TFSETVAGFDASDVVVTGGTKGTFTAVSGTVYTLAVTPDANTQAGTITVAEEHTAANQARGHGDTRPMQATQAYDTKAPTLVITDPAPTATSTLSLHDALPIFTFSETVAGFDASDVVVTGGTKGTFTAVSGTVYTLAVTPDANTQAGTIT